VLRLALEVSAASVALFMLVVVGYGFFSFLLMRSHTPYRAFLPTLREYVRETLLASITQPLMPLFYVYGDRMGPTKTGSVPIVFVHGYMQNRVGFVGLARLLTQRGLGPMYAINYPWWSSIPKNAKRLERYVTRVCQETKSPVVDLVCHSMGGLVAMEMMRNTAKKEDLKVRRCVTVATPHAGIAWRGPILGFEATSLRRGSKLLEAHSGYAVAVPTLSIYSSHDNLVHPKETSSLARRGGQDFEIANMAHFSILFSPVVADEIATFLSKPDRAPEIQEEIQELEEEKKHAPEAARV
jgi:pimeloyl-ACP methyl ester carboxylesterase